MTGKKTIVIQLLGNTITLNAEGIQLSSDKKITLEGASIELKAKGGGSIAIGNDVSINSGANKLHVGPGKIEVDGQLLELKSHSIMEIKSTILTDQADAVKKNKSGVQIINQ